MPITEKSKYLPYALILKSWGRPHCSIRTIKKRYEHLAMYTPVRHPRRKRCEYTNFIITTEIEWYSNESTLRTKKSNYEARAPLSVSEFKYGFKFSKTWRWIFLILKISITSCGGLKWADFVFFFPCKFKVLLTVSVVKALFNYAIHVFGFCNT